MGSGPGAGVGSGCTSQAGSTSGGRRPVTPLPWTSPPLRGTAWQRRRLQKRRKELRRAKTRADGPRSFERDNNEDRTAKTRRNLRENFDDNNVPFPSIVPCT